jgi:hypothetical protein
MDAKRLAVSLAILLSYPNIIDSQQTGTGSTQAATLLAQSLSALIGSSTVSDVTLNGNAQSIAGSDDESGTVVLKAMAPGESRMDLTLSGGSRSEIRSLDSANGPTGAWSGPDGVQHAMAYHNLLTDSSWFFPALTIQRLISNTAVVATYVGQQTLNGQSVIHVSISEPPAFATASSAPAAISAAMQHLTQMDFYLDPNSFLPVALSFTTHADSNARLDIPVQILFSNYQNIGGVQIPFHVQKFLNGNFYLDLQVQSAALNTGLSPSGFNIQVSQ